jgi:hypothetical protein
LPLDQILLLEIGLARVEAALGPDQAKEEAARAGIIYLRSVRLVLVWLVRVSMGAPQQPTRPAGVAALEPSAATQLPMPVTVALASQVQLADHPWVGVVAVEAASVQRLLGRPARRRMAAEPEALGMWETAQTERPIRGAGAAALETTARPEHRATAAPAS